MQEKRGDVMGSLIAEKNRLLQEHHSISLHGDESFSPTAEEEVVAVSFGWAWKVLGKFL